MVKLHTPGLLALSILTHLTTAMPAAEAIPAPETLAPTVRIMPFGASIVGAPGCWRALLWKKLQDGGIRHTDFVGSQPSQDCPSFPANSYDGENEGHAGALATEYVEKGSLKKWLEDARPDVVVMHLGTNDVLRGKSREEILKAYSRLVDTMRESKKSMRIIISHLIPLSTQRFSQEDADKIQELNKALPLWASRKTSSTSPIVLVDNYSGFNVDEDTDDGEHPNAKGSEKLANRFFRPVRDAVLSVQELCERQRDGQCVQLVQTAANPPSPSASPN